VGGDERAYLDLRRVVVVVECVCVYVGGGGSVQCSAVAMQLAPAIDLDERLLQVVCCMGSSLPEPTPLNSGQQWPWKNRSIVPVNRTQRRSRSHNAHVTPCQQRIPRQSTQHSSAWRVADGPACHCKLLLAMAVQGSSLGCPRPTSATKRDPCMENQGWPAHAKGICVISTLCACMCDNELCGADANLSQLTSSST
jgi:hypothetical protein